MSSLVLASFVAGATAQLLGSCPILPVTTVQLQPVYYSEVIPYNTIIDPFRNGTRLTISGAPTTIAISAYLTSTIVPGSTSTGYSTSLASSTSVSSSTSANISTMTTFANTTTSFSAVLSSTSTSTSTSTSISTSSSSSTSTAPVPNGCILDTTSGSTQSEIAAAINRWHTDIVYVNGFLESASAGAYTTSEQKRQAAQDAYTRAADEPCQFATIRNAATLGGLNNDTAYTCARDDLADIFPQGVLGNLQAIIDNPDEFTIRAQYININRCCRVLPDVDILFQKANSIFPGAQPQPNFVDAPVPRTCQVVSCSDSTGLTPCYALK